MQQGTVYRRGQGCPGTWKDTPDCRRVQGGPHHYEERQRESADGKRAESYYWCRRCTSVAVELPPEQPTEVSVKATGRVDKDGVVAVFLEPTDDTSRSLLEAFCSQMDQPDRRLARVSGPGWHSERGFTGFTISTWKKPAEEIALEAAKKKQREDEAAERQAAVVRYVDRLFARRTLLGRMAEVACSERKEELFLAIRKLRDEVTDEIARVVAGECSENTHTAVWSDTQRLIKDGGGA